MGLGVNQNIKKISALVVNNIIFLKLVICYSLSFKPSSFYFTKNTLNKIYTISYTYIYILVPSNYIKISIVQFLKS